MKTYKLQAHGKNELKKIALNEIKHILPQLEKYVGKQITTQSGLSKKFVVNLTFNPSTGVYLTENKPESFESGFVSRHWTFIEATDYDLVLKMSLCFHGGKYEDRTYYCQYFDSVFYLGRVKDAILTEVYNIDKIIENHRLNDIINLENEVQKIEKYKKLEEEIRTLKYSIQLDF